VFGLLKQALKGHRFRSDEDVKAIVVQWFQQQPREFFVEGIHWLEVCGMPALAPMGTV
jgi:hypothetical protein